MQRKDPFKVIGAVFSIAGVLAIVFLPGFIQDCNGHRKPPAPPTLPTPAPTVR